LRLDPVNEYASSLFNRIRFSAAKPWRLLLPDLRFWMVVVAAAAAGAIASLARFGLSAEGAAGAVFLAIVALLAVINFHSRIYPNRIVIPSYAIVLAMTLASRNEHRVVVHLEAGLAFGGALLGLGLIFPSSIGMGDVKAGALIGFAVGHSISYAAVAATVATALLLLDSRLRRWEESKTYGRASWPILVTTATTAFLVGGW
jgi:prepilin signal peptidase PulO-like enzyme (type II secretory pathway)